MSASYSRFSPFSHEQTLMNLHSSSNHSCHGGIQWIWTVMGDCAITTREQISAYVGLLSMVTWMSVGIPQIIKNFRNIDGMAGISFLLLFQWTAGDTTNLVGAILTNQLKPQIYLAVFFVLSDTFLLAQYLAFFIRLRRRVVENAKAITKASRTILCLVGLTTISHCLMGNLVPSFTSDSSHSAQNLPAGYMSRVLLSSDDGDPLVFRSENDSSWVAFTNSTRRQHQGPAFWHDTKDVVGYIIGCVSSVFYVGSRLAQILMNRRKKSTEGLAIMTFILAVFGNLTYGGQILIQDLHNEFLIEHTPWLVGSLGVIGLDCTLLWQFHYYKGMDRRRDETRQSLLHNEDCVINTEPTLYGAVEPRLADGFTDSLY